MYVKDLEQINSTNLTDAGGKGAQLGELLRIDGLRVPAGFCVTTAAFRQAVAAAPSISTQLDVLSRVEPNDHTAIRSLSAEVRTAVEGITLPDDLVAAITGSLTRFGEQVPYAVRSSATAEDLPTASFAGQHDSYLDIIGPEAILQHVRKCWASLFTERAVTYRLRNGIDHRDVWMAVVVQQLVSAEVAGVLFTADPMTSHRKVATVEAVRGLGEALVSGLVNADVFTVRDDRVHTRAIAGEQPTLTDAQVVSLVQWGRRIEAHFGRPQDIEWCLVGDEVHIVQSRPITTLFPVPPTDDQENHLYVSVGHQQMMTDAMKPLGLSLWQATTPMPMHEAGGRLFVDVAAILATPAGRAHLIDLLGKSDPLIRDALQTVVDRGDFLRSLPDDANGAGPAAGLPGGDPITIETDPAVVADLVAENRASVATLRREIEGLSGPALLDFILSDLIELRRILFDPRSHQALMASMEATWWLNDNLEAWLGETNAADALTQSVPHNVTAEMGLALLDVADTIRPYADVVTFLQQVVDEGREDDTFLAELEHLAARGELAGGREAAAAIRGFLDTYGIRGTGEIDITRTRWSERPAMLAPTILGNVRNFEPGAGERRFDRGLQESQRKEDEVLARVRALPDGERKATETKQMIVRVRTFAGYREYPKYGIVSRYFIYKQALLREAERLVQSGTLRATDDIFFLRLEEVQEVVRSNHADAELILDRREAFQSYESLIPPRVLTSDGEVVTGRYHRGDAPSGALVGLAVSAGTIEGRARVIMDMERADLESGDILVTAYTDPSWTPLFVSIAGLVTEVGGLMTHGAVIAREYGLPAVVGVEQATRLIRDGQRIRIDGTNGSVELLD